MTIRLISAAALALTMLAPISQAQTVPSPARQHLGPQFCDQSAKAVDGSCVAPTAGSVGLGAVIVNTDSAARGPTGEDPLGKPKSTNYTIIYKANPDLTWMNGSMSSK